MGYRFSWTGLLCCACLFGCGGKSESDVEISLMTEGDEESSSLPQRPVAATMFTPGTLDVDVMEVVVPEDLIAAFKKLQRFPTYDPTVYEELDAETLPGQMLPYHPRMGISRETYRELVAFLETISPVRVRGATIGVERVDEAVYRLTPDKTLPELNPLRIDFDTLHVTTPVGELSESVALERGDVRGVLAGEWNGRCWVLFSEDEKRPIVQFGLGRLSETGRGTLFLAVDPADGSGRAAFTLLRFDLPPEDFPEL